MDKTAKKILIVEDDQFLRDFYQELLTAEGYQIDVAPDGDIALEKLSQGGWDLVLLDIMLPKKDGLQILQDIKTTPPKSAIGPIVVLTNLGHDTVINKAFVLGAGGYLVKSALNPDEVLKEVKSFLQKS
ncbi:MAG: response regulator [Candidatus Daviesbacteria bacterium]|nr:response regulator [Candidatus Daviesbacteria bacterium]